MRKNAVKKVLFTLASLATLPARADDGQINDLRLMEELPTEQRVSMRVSTMNSSRPCR
jgi:hypothetical protein